MTLRSLLGLLTTIIYKSLIGKSDLFVHYLAGVKLLIILLKLLNKPRRRFIFNRHSLTVLAALLADDDL
jgi:hypothetical protein